MYARALCLFTMQHSQPAREDSAMSKPITSSSSSRHPYVQQWLEDLPKPCKCALMDIEDLGTKKPEVRSLGCVYSRGFVSVQAPTGDKGLWAGYGFWTRFFWPLTGTERYGSMTDHCCYKALRTVVKDVTLVDDIRQEVAGRALKMTEFLLLCRRWSVPLCVHNPVTGDFEWYSGHPGKRARGVLIVESADGHEPTEEGVVHALPFQGVRSCLCADPPVTWLPELHRYEEPSQSSSAPPNPTPPVRCTRYAEKVPATPTTLPEDDALSSSSSDALSDLDIWELTDQSRPSAPFRPIPSRTQVCGSRAPHQPPKAPVALLETKLRWWEAIFLKRPYVPPPKPVPVVQPEEQPSVDQGPQVQADAVGLYISKAFGPNPPPILNGHSNVVRWVGAQTEEAPAGPHVRERENWLDRLKDRWAAVFDKRKERCAFECHQSGIVGRYVRSGDIVYSMDRGGCTKALQLGKGVVDIREVTALEAEGATLRLTEPITVTVGDNLYYISRVLPVTQLASCRKLTKFLFGRRTTFRVNAINIKPQVCRPAMALLDAIPCVEAKFRCIADIVSANAEAEDVPHLRNCRSRLAALEENILSDVDFCAVAKQVAKVSALVRDQVGSHKGYTQV